MAILTKKILFVDDRTKRINYALREYVLPEWDLTLATCVPEALRLLSKEEWDVVSLDHDLNGHDFQDPDTPTCGMEIVRYIEKCGGWPSGVVGYSRKIPMFWIHSSNLFASHLMTLALSAMGLSCRYMPITYPVENMKYDTQGNPT